MRRSLAVFTILSGIAFAITGWAAATKASAAPESAATAKQVEIVSDSASGTSITSERSNLRVGAAKAKIEIPDNFFPYTAWGPRHMTSLRDDLYVRVIMIANEGAEALLISVETGDLSDEWLIPIASMSGVPECNIFLSATHTHSAPFISESFAELGLKDKEKSKAFADNAWDALSKAVQAALQNMQPAKFSYATGECDINVNRDFKNTGTSEDITAPYYTDPNPHGICDKTVSVMKFVDMSGQPIAYVMNYSIHSIVMFASYNEEGGMEITGDIAGYTSKYIEDRSGENCVAMFTMACSADTMPKYTANYHVYNAQGNFTSVDANEAGWTLLELQAMALGTEALRVGANMKDFTSEAAISGTTKNITVPGKQKFNQGPPTTVPRDYKFIDGDPIELRLGLLLIDEAAIVGIPAELVTSAGLNIKKTLAGLGCANALCVTQCNGSVSYISDDYGYANLTFSAIASRCKPGTDKLIVEEVKNMYAVLSEDSEM